MFYKKAGLMVLAAWAMTGCTTKLVPCQPRAVQLTLAASDHVNPDDMGQSLPTTVRLYQLKSPARLENARFEEVWKDPKASVGDDLLQFEEVVLFPNDQLTRSYTRSTPSSYLAAMAVFRKPSGTSWRVIPVLPNDVDQMCPEKDPKLHPLDIMFYLEDFRIDSRDLSQTPAQQ